MNLTTSIFPENQYQDLNFRDRLVEPVRQWLDNIAVGDPQVPRWLCQLIRLRGSCERDIQLWGHHLFHIPPICNLNPVYEELVGLRFRLLSYLTDV